MKRNKFFGFLFFPIVMCASGAVLCQCSSQHTYQQPKIQFDTDNKLKFSYNTLEWTPHCNYPFSIQGKIQVGDLIEVSIYSQERGGQPGLFVHLSNDSTIIYLSPQKKDYQITIDINADYTQDISVYDLTISLKYVRMTRAITRVVISHVIFANATPTTNEMFEIKHEDENVILNGFKDNEPWIQESLKLCNVLLIPRIVDTVNEYAFSLGHSKIPVPTNIVRLWFEGSLSNDFDCKTHIIKQGAFNGISSIIEQLILPNTISTIENNAFSGCNFTSISIPCSIELNIQNEAFAENLNLNKIDLSQYYELMPEWGGKNIFKDSPEMGTVLVANADMIDKWKNYFQLTTEDDVISAWDYQVKQSD